MYLIIDSLTGATRILASGEDSGGSNWRLQLEHSTAVILSHHYRVSGSSSKNMGP